MSAVNVYVVIDLERLGKATDTPQTYGSIAELVSANITDRGEVLTYAALWNRLSKNSDNHYWKNEKFLIKKCVVHRKENKNKTVKK